MRLQAERPEPQDGRLGIVGQSRTVVIVFMEPHPVSAGIARFRERSVVIARDLVICASGGRSGSVSG
jgi:hypothetical protein